MTGFQWTEGLDEFTIRVIELYWAPWEIERARERFADVKGRREYLRDNAVKGQRGRCGPGMPWIDTLEGGRVQAWKKTKTGDPDLDLTIARFVQVTLEHYGLAQDGGHEQTLRLF